MERSAFMSVNLISCPSLIVLLVLSSTAERRSSFPRIEVSRMMIVY